MTALIGVTGHHIVLRFTDHKIGLSCSCRRIATRGQPRHDWIEIRELFPARDAITAYHRWHATKGVIV